MASIGGMGGSAWDRSRIGSPMNADRSGWNGICPGDIVEVKYEAWKASGRVVRLHSNDRDGITIKTNGREMKVSSEWCTIVRKVDEK